ncbi:MAG: hypothetical protein ACTSPY_07715 [Candidatus Helarchaeota archaeon]
MDRLEKIDDILKSGLIHDFGLRDEIITLIKKKCDICNSIPIECALQPHCGDRKLLKSQIELELPYEKLPHFCYEQQLQTIIRFMNGQVNLIEPIDVKIFLNDFLHRILKEKKIKIRNSDNLYSKLIVKLSEYRVENFYPVRNEKEGLGEIIFMLNDAIYVLDFNKQVAIINYYNSTVKDEDELKMILEILGHRYNLEFEINEELLGWWKLKFIFDKNLKVEDEKYNNLKLKLKKYVKYVNFYKTYDNYFLKIDLKTPKSPSWERDKLSIREMIEIFKIINEFLGK